jgi:hypothetical protein
VGNEDENGCKDDCDDRIVSGIIVGGGVTVGVAAVANGNVLATVSDVEADRDGIDGDDGAGDEHRNMGGEVPRC